MKKPSGSYCRFSFVSRVAASLRNWRTAYYGDAATRLTKLKRQYDPEGFFTYPQAL